VGAGVQIDASQGADLDNVYDGTSAATHSRWNKSMARAQEVIMYSRPDCHLCELAAQMLEESNVTWYEIDIESDLDLIRKHGTRIPVLYRADIDRELVWPFNNSTVEAFVAHEI
jgi:glutaredoxin